jgi:hypothetical protein
MIEGACDRSAAQSASRKGARGAFILGFVVYGVLWSAPTAPAMFEAAAPTLLAQTSPVDTQSASAAPFPAPEGLVVQYGVFRGEAGRSPFEPSAVRSATLDDRLIREGALIAASSRDLDNAHPSAANLAGPRAQAPARARAHAAPAQVAGCARCWGAGVRTPSRRTNLLAFLFSGDLFRSGRRVRRADRPT